MRCSIKVVVKANWFMTRCLKDWFVLQPLTITEEIIDKIDHGVTRVFNSLGKPFRRLGKKCQEENNNINNNNTVTTIVLK